MAAYRIVKGFDDALGVNEIDPAAIPVEQIQIVSRIPFLQWPQSGVMILKGITNENTCC